MSQSAPETRWVARRTEALKAALEERLGAALGDLEIASPPAPRGDEPWRLTVNSGGLKLHIHGPSYQGPRWFETSGLGVSYGRGDDGSDPYESPERAQQLKGLRKRLEQADLSWLEEDLNALWRLDGLRDEALRQISMGRGRPYGIIRLGFRCNQDCAFCWQSRSWPEPDTATCKAWIDAFASQGVTNLIFSGGEPTLYKSLPALITHAAQTHGMEVGLETNAIRFRKASYLSDLMARGMSKALISLHSADPRTSDKMTRAPGTWEGTVAGTEAALEAGLLVALNCVVDRDNVDTLKAHAEFIVRRFASRADAAIHQVIYSHPSSAWDGAHYAEKQVSLERVRPSLLAACTTLLDAGLTVSTGGSCGFPPCIVAEEPRLQMHSRASDFATADLSGRDFGEACSDCARRPMCLGVRREYLERFGERGLRTLDA
ncbi:MAG: radical SAM protein [Myxococcota bacterium]